MNRSTKPARLRALLALALGIVALLALAGLAAAKDGNDDRIPDHWEKRHNLSLKIDQSRRDQDHDQLRNRAEFRSGNDPRDRDSDDDGVVDGEENAGTIASFDAETGRLTIDLFGAEQISGLVTEETRIKCEDEHSHDVGGVHQRHGTGANCTTADLVVGAVVEEADLEIEHGKATFDEVELAH